MIRTVLKLSLFSAVLLASPVLAQDSKTKPQSDDDKVVCKAQGETGSLVKKKKKCMTKRDWKVLADATREQALGGQMSGSASGQ